MEEQLPTQIGPTAQSIIIDGLTRLAWLAYENAAAHGFHDEPFNFGEKIALIHSEISESLEHWRKSQNAPDDKLPQYPGWLVELADAIIRIGDLTGKLGAHQLLGEVLAAKMNYNLSRPYKHGKAF